MADETPKFEADPDPPRLGARGVQAALEARRQAYMRKFGDRTDPDTRLILEDLAVFCRAIHTTFHQDPRVSAALEGRREVFLRITDHAQLGHDALYDYYHLRGVRR